MGSRASILALTLVVGLLAGCGDGAVPPDERPARVLVIGADGLDPDLVGRLIEQGRLPNLTRFVGAGAQGKLYSEEPMRSPAIWTTMVTGRPRSVHGIYDWVVGSPFWQEPVPPEREGKLATSDLRRVDALWNLVSRAGGSVAVVGWLNTWPAEPVNGVMVAPYVALGEEKQETIKGAVYADEQRQVYPETRWAELRPLVVDGESLDEALVSEFARSDDELRSFHPKLPRYEAGLRWSLAHTLTMRGVARHLLERDRPDLTMVYFEGADSLGHRFWLFRQSVPEIKAAFSQLGLDPSRARPLRRAYGRVVDRYYDLLDESIGALITAAGPETTVLIVSDHGFGNSRQAQEELPFSGTHDLLGFIGLSGRGVEPGSQLVGASIYDVAPTVAAQLGLEVPEAWEGGVLKPVVPSGPEAGEPGSDEAEEPSAAEEELERLRSLGYIQ